MMVLEKTLESPLQSIKEIFIKVNEQMRNRNRELKTSTKCICKWKLPSQKVKNDQLENNS